jgi:oligosaccharide repeat unit polymerase wzy
MGLLENMVSFREEKVRNSFGFIYATDFAAHIFYLVLMYFYLRSGKFNLIEIMLFLYSSFFIANQCDARLDSICIIMIVFFSIYINLTKGRDCYFSGYKYIFPLCALLIIFLTYLYSTGDDFILLINFFLSGRLALGFDALMSKGIPLLGQKYIQYGAGSGIYYNFIDSSYLVLLIIYGIILFLLVMYVYVRICSHCISIRNRVLLYVLFMIAINSMIEQHFMEFAYNPFYMAFSAKLIKST